VYTVYTVYYYCSVLLCSSFILLMLLLLLLLLLLSSFITVFIYNFVYNNFFFSSPSSRVSSTHSLTTRVSYSRGWQVGNLLHSTSTSVVVHYSTLKGRFYCIGSLCTILCLHLFSHVAGISVPYNSRKS